MGKGQPPGNSLMEVFNIYNLQEKSRCPWQKNEQSAELTVAIIVCNVNRMIVKRILYITDDCKKNSGDILSACFKITKGKAKAAAQFTTNTGDIGAQVGMAIVMNDICCGYWCHTVGSRLQAHNRRG